jgi:hypothetical protein
MNHQQPIFFDIMRGDLEEVQRRVLAQPVVLEERSVGSQRTPLIYAIYERCPNIALWLIQHRGQHDVNSRDRYGRTALHWACYHGQLSVVQALVGAGANPAALDNGGYTPLMLAASFGQPDIVAFLLQLPAAKAAINAISRFDETALSLASLYGRLCIVQLLLDHGADPTIPAGPDSPLNRALNNGHTAIAALLRRAINDAGITRTLHKARSLLDAAATIAKARKDAHDKGLSPAEQQHKALAAAPEWLKGRVAEEGRALPRAELIPPPPQQQQQQPVGPMTRRRHKQHQHQEEQEEQQQQQHDVERLRATAAYAVGLEGGEKGGMVDDVYVKLLEYMTPPWADKGPAAAAAAVGDQQQQQQQQQQENA